MALYNKFNTFVADVNNKVHNFGADTFKVILTNVAPVAANAVKADITEIAGGNGYAAGGASLTLVSSAQVAGTYIYKASLPNPTWTASGTIATFRYVVLYNSTPGPGNLIAWWDYGANVIVTVGQTFTVALDPTNGVFQDA